MKHVTMAHAERTKGVAERKANCQFTLHIQGTK